MIVETVITSVPRGLKAGRTGYQPVMRTRGLRDDVLRQLEPLTGYRHIHRQGSGKNPLNYTYRRLTSNVGDLAVLGRTVDAGSDFSNRSNKCGHLIAFTADEIGRLSRTTPAALLADNQALFASQWTKGPEERPAPPALAAQPQTPAICTTWQSQFGDAGWAAVVAERARRRQPTLLVAPDSSPLSSDLLLRLIREATGLLPPADRWAVSFETTVLGASDALIQGTYRGSPEAEAARQGVLVLPLGGPVPPGQLQENDLCKLARFGPPKPAAAAPPPVAPTTTVPNAADDFLSDVPTAPAAGSPPPLLPSAPNRRVGSFEPLQEEKQVPWGTIIGASVSFLLIAFCAAWFVIANILPASNDKKKPTQPNVNQPKKETADQDPQDVLESYLTNSHKKPQPKDLPQPSLVVWGRWLKAREVEEKINEDWVLYANAILRKCIASDPFAKWKQKERTFHDAVQHITQAEPTARDLNFLLVAKDLTESNEADAFTKAALNAYERNYSKKEKPNPEEIIDTAILANKLHEMLRGFLSKKPQKEDPEDRQLAALVSDYSKATWLPEIDGDKNGLQTKLFLLSLRNQTASPDSMATAPTFDEFASFVKKFNKALSDLNAYAKDPDIPSNISQPSMDTYRTVYGETLELETKGLTARDLNKALQAIGTVPEKLQPILDADRLIKEWDKLRSDFGMHKYDPAKRKIVLADGLNFSKEFRDQIKPIFATTTVASTGSNPWNFFHSNQEPSCTVKWEEDGTKLVAEFHETPEAEVLLRLPLVIKLYSKLNINKKTEPKSTINEHFQFATSADPSLTIAAFAESGGVEYVQVAGSQQSNTAATLANLVAVVEPPHLRWDTSHGSQKENSPSVSVEQYSAGDLQGKITFLYETPTTERPTQTEESFGPSESLNASIAYTFQPKRNRLRFEFTETNDLTVLNLDKRLSSTKRSLKRNSVGSNVFSDIAYEVYSLSAGESKLRKNELDAVLIDIVSDHAFGVHETDFLGENPLYGEKDNGSKLLEHNNFSDPDKPGVVYDRALLGKAGVESLEKRSWEMALASYLIKHSSKFSEKAKLRAAKEKEIKDIEKELEKLNKDPEKNKQDIDEQKETIGGKQKEKRQIDDWFLIGWVKEDLRAIAASVRREAAKKQSDEGRRTEIAARLFLNLRPFLARYLLANDEESKKIPLSSLLSTEIWFKPKSGDFGREFLLAVINQSPLADNTVPPKASDEQTSPDITDQQP